MQYFSRVCRRLISITLRKCCNLASNFPACNCGARPDTEARSSAIYSQHQIIGFRSEVNLSVQETGHDLARLSRDPVNFLLEGIEALGFVPELYPQYLKLICSV